MGAPERWKGRQSLEDSAFPGGAWNEITAHTSITPGCPHSNGRWNIANATDFRRSPVEADCDACTRAEVELRRLPPF